MFKITKIEKSWKKEGYAFVALEGKKEFRLRKVYTYKSKPGLGFLYLDTDVFQFNWDGTYGTNITWIGNYKSVEEAVQAVEAQEEKPAKKEAPAPQIIDVEDGEIRHEQYSKIKTCVELDIPVYLVGPAGSGKNHVLEQLAWDLGLDFYFTNSIQQEFKLTGFVSPKLTGEDKFVETEFYRAFTKGGLFFLDELDASIPEVLVLLNAAIANRYFEFPGMGKVEAHENFRVVAAGNTFGNGGDEQYTGRMVLDQATLDRFTVIQFDYSEKIELHLAKGNITLVQFIRELRKQAAEKGIRATFSYRCITMITKLEGKLAIEDIMVMSVFKGMDKDTLNTFKSHQMPTSRYSEALRKVQM